MAIAVLHESTVAEAEVNDAAVRKETFSTDRRAEARLSAKDASWLRGARLKYGSDVRVIDVSRGGILVESEGALLEPRTNIVFELSGPCRTQPASRGWQTLSERVCVQAATLDRRAGRHRSRHVRSAHD
jgi:hypothetical protein